MKLDLIDRNKRIDEIS